MNKTIHDFTRRTIAVLLALALLPAFGGVLADATGGAVRIGAQEVKAEPGTTGGLAAPTDLAWKEGTSANATWKGVAGAHHYIVELKKNGSSYGAQTIIVDNDEDGIQDETPDVADTPYSCNLNQWVNNGGTDDYTFSVVAVLTEDPWVASDAAASESKRFITYPITINNGTAYDDSNEIWQALPGTRVTVNNRNPYPEYAEFDHFVIDSGLTEEAFDPAARSFLMPENAVELTAVHKVKKMDMGNIWNTLVAGQEIPFTTALDPDGTLDEMVTIKDQYWKDTSTGREIRAGSGRPEAGRTYEFAAVLEPKNGFTFTAEKFDPLIYGGTEVAAAKQKKTLNTDGTVTLSWGLTAKCTVVPVTGVTVKPTAAGIQVGKTLPLAATVKPSDATNKKVTWKSEDNAIATVNASGVVTGKKVGETTITVTTDDGKKTANCKVTVSFTDVPRSGKYCSDPVYWAVKKNITNGYTDKDGLARTFKPAENCTRAQMVTFLWRHAGKPAPKTKKNPFKDVKSNAYYYKAVLWAVEKGITKGYAGNVFKPDAPCQREHAVTFLWRYAGKPGVSSKKGFKDVKSKAYYYKAVLWAVNKGITKGYSDGTFKPAAKCQREHIVTFLYRYKK